MNKSKNHKDISNRLAITLPSINQAKQELDIIKRIKNNMMVNWLPKCAKAWENYIDSIPKDSIDKNLKFQAVKKTLESAEIITSGKESIHIRNLYQQQANILFTPIINGILRSYAHALIAGRGGEGSGTDSTSQKSNFFPPSPQEDILDIDILSHNNEGEVK